jgi:streptogramin lyase
MSRNCLIPVVVLWAALLLSCGGTGLPALEELSPAPRVSALVIDRIIEGDLLGKPLRYPSGLAVDLRGSVYVTDAGNHRLIKLTSSLEPQADIGGFGSAPGLLNRPGFVAVDNALSVLVADAGNGRLSRFDSRLNFTDDISLLDVDDPGRFGEPAGVALASYGEVWMADIDKNRIAVFDAAAKFDRFVAEFGYSGGQVNEPHKIVSDPVYEFLICDAGNGRIGQYDQYGNHVRSIGGKVLNYPIAAAVDTTGRIWVVDTKPLAIVCLSSFGEVIFESGSNLPGLNTNLSGVADIAVLPDQRLLLADRDNNRLVVCRVVSFDG